MNSSTSADSIQRPAVGELLSAMAEHSPTLVVIFGFPDLRTVYMNPAARKQLNPADQLNEAELTLSDLVGVEFTDRLTTEIMPQARVSGQWSGRLELKDAWGGEFVAVGVLSAIPGAAGSDSMFLCLEARPDARATGQACVSDRDLLHELLETIPDHVYFKDRESRFLRISLAMAKRFGLSDAKDAIGKTDFDIFTAEHATPAFNAEQEIIRTGTPIVGLEERETWENGDISWVVTTKLPLHDGDGSIVGTFGISRDITKIKRAEDDRRKLEAKLLLANKLESIGRLAAGVAHEINTPSQYIITNAHFLEQAFAKLVPVLAADRQVRVLAGTHPDCIAAVEAAQAAENAAELDYLLTEVPRTLTETFEGLDRVTRIVHSLKELSHPKPDKALADLNRAIETAVMVSRHEWKYVADLVTDFELGLPLVPCIVDQFSQVMLNLIVNAAHAVADALKASGAERGRITVRTRLAGRCALVEVQDTGTGIAEEIRGRIFEPFFTTKGVGEGTGQGLAIVRTAIVANHGGTVDFETEVGVGTTFRIRLPLEAGSGTS